MDRPRYLLFVEAASATESSPGRWRFSLEGLESGEHLDAEDQEKNAGLYRLELIGLVRGLEALDQPSRVTLVSTSRNLNRGLRTGLPLWRENDWQWERFGEMTPIKDADLWKRVDLALTFHEVSSRTFRLDMPSTIPQPMMAANQVSPSRSLVDSGVECDIDAIHEEVQVPRAIQVMPKSRSERLRRAARPTVESLDDALVTT